VGYAEHRARREADAGWSHAARERSVIRFLTSLDPLPTEQAVPVRPERAAHAADGRAITRSDGVVFREELTESDVRGADIEAEACAALIIAEQTGELPALLRALASAGGSANAEAMARFARSLPLLDDATITPARLEALGLWGTEAREAAELLQARAAGAPRYFVGRRLLLPGGIHSLGTLTSLDQQVGLATVLVDGSNEEMSISWQALLLLNQRHVLPSTTSSDGGIVLRLEDGLWANLGAPLMRAELARVALALGPVFAGPVRAALDANNDDALDDARAAALVAMRGCLDVTSFARAGGNERGRDRERYASDNVGKMAAHGEGHCRTLSSCLAPFLWSFAEVLAVDCQYCTDAGARHQWLQYATRPSMRTFACDMYRDENAFQHGGERGVLLAQPTEDAYAVPTDVDGDGNEWQIFPRDEPLMLGGRPVRSAPLEPTDVASVTPHS